MYEKHCRHCDARVPQGRGSLDNYCCEDHRVAFQDKQHRETVERLRREEPDEQAESEFALHSFEPRRVRVSMQAGSESDSSVGPMRTAEPPNYISRAMPPHMMPPAIRVQPLVAPPLQPKASVEQGLAALSFVSEPMSAPLQIPAAYAKPRTESLGATVRRQTQTSDTAAPTSKNIAIVNLIRGAKERMAFQRQGMLGGIKVVVADGVSS